MPTYILINDTYILGKRLGKGSFGEVYQGYHRVTWQPVAIKLEPLNSKSHILEHEYHVYKNIYRPDQGLCQCYYYGVQDAYCVMVIDMLGPSLASLLNQCGGRFSLKTVLMIADQLLNRLEYLHENHFVHRDIKPENILIGIGGDRNRLYIIDYGLAKQYRVGNKHISYKTGYKLVGTARYASLNSHLGYRLSRRDDIESLLFLLVYFLKGSLPWQNLDVKDRIEKYSQIALIKTETAPAKLCEDCPEIFQTILEDVRGLEYTERPNYQLYRRLIGEEMQRQGYVYDLTFDWLCKN